MRLWHKDLIDVLPRQQLLGQWRELCAIMRNIEEKGTPNHVLVNKVTKYPCVHIYVYADYVRKQMNKRGYACNFCKFEFPFAGWVGLPTKTEISSVSFKDLFKGWHNDRYMVQCFYNLQEKYDCGGITDEEFSKIYSRFTSYLARHPSGDGIKSCIFR